MAATAFTFADTDEPFGDLRAELDLFVAYLRAQGVHEQYFPQFEAEALAFRTRFYRVLSDELDEKALDVYLEGARRESLPERTLRNRRIACEAFLRFLRFLRETASPSDGKLTENRRSARVTFRSKVLVDNLGLLRCSDLSVGGMYLETVCSVGVGKLLQIQFKLRSSDPLPIVLTGRVAFVDPQLGAGVEFVKMTREDAKRIADFVAEAVSQ